MRLADVELFCPQNNLFQAHLVNRILTLIRKKKLRYRRCIKRRWMRFEQSIQYCLTRGVDVQMILQFSYTSHQNPKRSIYLVRTPYILFHCITSARRKFSGLR